ncbi:hypothetical protein [Leptolyngbya sp. AN10]|uniref:hypothetical protein n=1 Tax=Leptolyngbya sp. AN10 TaxID=3423365 RepID=UPI003D31AA6E
MIFSSQNLRLLLHINKALESQRKKPERRIDAVRLIIEKVGKLHLYEDSNEADELIKAIRNPTEFYLHSLGNLHLFQQSDEYQCESAIAVWNFMGAEQLSFTPPIKTTLRIREMSIISLFRAEEGHDCAIASMFHKGCTYFGLVYLDLSEVIQSLQ